MHAHLNTDVLASELTSSYAYVPALYTLSLFKPHPSSESRSLAGLDGRPRRRVARRHGIVNVDQDTRVRRLERAGERDLVLRAECAGAASDGELGTRDVELGTAGASGRVKTDVLSTQQVVAVLQTFRDSHGDRLGA